MARSVATITRNANLATEFGYEWACKLFGEEAIASLRKLKTGPNKGKPAGDVFWLKSTEAGYCREAGHAVPANYLLRAWIQDGANRARGVWGGRVQELAGSRVYLFESGRQRFVTEALLNRGHQRNQDGDRYADQGKFAEAAAAYDEAADLYEQAGNPQAKSLREMAAEMRDKIGK
jgi:hypothetical protein